MRHIARAALAACVPAFAANAEMTVGQPLQAPYEADVSIEFVSSSAGWTGEVRWFPADDFEDAGVLAFVNKNAEPGDLLASAGVVQQGQTIPLGYNIIKGVPDLYRMDDPATVEQFAYEWLAPDRARVFIEDIRLPGGDADYNDAIVDLTFNAVPEPGSVALAASGVLLWSRRRRDETIRRPT